MVLVLTAFFVLQAPTVSPRDAATGQARGAFTIRGRVLDAITAEPIRGAEVGVTPATEPLGSQSAITDDEGRWQITGLPAGDYNLFHSKPGYNRVRGVQIHSPVHVSPQHPVRDIALVLVRGGVITGRVTDSRGEPALGMRVQAMRVANNDAWISTQGDVTDDRGEFRLYGLESGDYLLTARPELRQFFGPAANRVGVVVTFYPGTARHAEAERVVVVDGETTDVTFQLQTASTVTVSGRVVTSSGRSLRTAWIILQDSKPDVTIRGLQPTSSAVFDGRFSIRGVLPGEYIAKATARFDEGDDEFGEARLVVDDKDAEVVVPTRGPFVVSGRVLSLAREVIAGTVFRASAIPAESSHLSRPGGDAAVHADGTFRIKCFSPRVRIRIAPQANPLGWRVRDVTWKGESVMKSGIDFSDAGDSVAGVEVIMVGATARLQGLVREAGGGLLKNGTVLIFPAEQAVNSGSPFEIFRAVVTNGAFVSRPLAPDRYLVAAVSETAPTMPSGDLIERLRSQAMALELTDHQTL